MKYSKYDCIFDEIRKNQFIYKNYWLINYEFISIFIHKPTHLGNIALLLSYLF